MSRNWAIVIGINQYNPNNFTSLKYAKHDAELMRDFFQQAGFNEVCFFTDDSPDLRLPNGLVMHTQPTVGNLRSFLHDRFDTKPFLSTGDNCWFFFAGHGGQYQNRDYLMPQDANPRNVEHTAIPVNYVRERLLRSGADNVILVLDACRIEGSRSGSIGNESQQGIITISACSPTQHSWEIDALQQGVFTYALLEALKSPIELKCETVERLGQFLRCRVPQLCKHYGKVPEQNPRISVDPIEKSKFILLSDYIHSTGKRVSSNDIETLKQTACKLAFIDKKIDLAEQLCVRASSAAMGQDLEILQLYNELKQSKAKEQPGIENTGARNSVTQPASRQPKPTAKATPPKQLDDDLSSDKGIDYRHLRDLLYRGEWKQADRQTSTLMCQMANRTADRWLRVKDVDSLPKRDLTTINQLWTKYSDGKFGFGTQQQIWKACGSPTSYSEAWRQFVEKIEWYKDGVPNRYGYSLNPNDAPRGHFPRDFAFSALEGGTARGKEPFPKSLTVRLLSRTF